MQDRGFTILEIMIVMTVMAIAIAIGWPTLRTSQARTSVRSAREMFVGRHSLARSTAIRYSRTALLHIDTTGDQFWVEVDTSALRTGTTDTIGVITDIYAELGVDLTSTRTLVCFAAGGLATQAQGCPPGDLTVVFSRDGYADTVTVTALGKLMR